VDVQIFFPNTMFTSGYDEENKTKPAIVKKIEEGDDGITADQGCCYLIERAGEWTCAHKWRHDHKLV
jgi:3-dehydrosphinganine reductase